MSRTWKDRSWNVNQKAARHHGCVTQGTDGPLGQGSEYAHPGEKTLSTIYVGQGGAYAGSAHVDADVHDYAAKIRRGNSRLADSVLASESPRCECGWCYENHVHRDRKRGYVDPEELADVSLSSIPGSLKNDEWKRPAHPE